MAELPNEAHAFLAAHPDIAFIDAFFADLNGILRGKRLSTPEIAKAYSGIGINRASVLLDPRGLSLDGGGIGFSDGDPDLVARAIPGTLAPVPWSALKGAQILLQVTELSGAPIAFDPRAALAKIAGRFAELGLVPHVALELEFYLIDAAGAVPQPPCSPKTGRRETIGQVYGMAELEEFGPVLDGIGEAARLQGLKTGTIVKEYGIGQ